MAPSFRLNWWIFGTRLASPLNDPVAEKSAGGLDAYSVAMGERVRYKEMGALEPTY
jgi:hypothetical protein